MCVCSYCAGLFVGEEGPMIHSGAIVGAGVPQFRSMVFQLVKIRYHYFRSDRYWYKYMFIYRQYSMYVYTYI